MMLAVEGRWGSRADENGGGSVTCYVLDLGVCLGG